MGLPVSSSSNLLILLTLLWHTPLSQPKVQICCCPDLTLSLSAAVTDTTKSLQNGFMFVAIQGSDVSLKCELTDKDHEAVHSVVYKFHKTYELGTSKPISLDSKKKEVCSNDKDSQATCELKNVTYSATSDKSQSLDTADNHIYQCYAEITLVDGGLVKLWSHTIKLDVYYPPIQPTFKPDTKVISTGKALEKLICNMPDSNPKTNPKWMFKKDGTDTFKEIDIPNDTRGDRLVIAEDTISLNSQGDIKRGMLLIMIFNPDEDQGTYKCEGVYDTVFDDTHASFKISEYAVSSNDQQDSGSLLLRAVSEITNPKLVNQDSIVNFTVYARDTPGRGAFGDVTYTWQIKGDPDVDVDFQKYNESLKLSNHDRTLTVSDLTKHVNHNFQCKISRATPSSNEIKSDSLGVKTPAVVIAPKYLSVPLTSKTCVNYGSNLKATPNKSYMMASSAKAGFNPKQILLKADSWKFYINDYKVMFITDNADNFDNETAAGVSQEQFSKKLPYYNESHSCIYWQYLRGYGLQYQLIEVMKIHRFADGGQGIKNIDLQSYIDTVKIAKENSKVKVTFKPRKAITTSQCVKLDLVDSDDNILASESRPPISESCANWTVPETLEFTGIKEEDLRIKIHSDCGGSGISSSRDSKDSSVLTILLAVVMVYMNL